MRIKQIAVVIAFCLILASVTAVLAAMRPERNTFSPLTCTFLKVGKADAIVLEADGKCIVIDTGEEDDGPEIVDFLKNRNIPIVDVLIITHYDKDHVGGADTLIGTVPVVRVLVPDYEGSSTEYSDFVNAMKNAGINPERISDPTTIAMGDMVITVTPPVSYDIPKGVLEYDNNLSLVTTVSHGINKLLFAADIEKERITELISGNDLGECIFLKVPHHGIYNTALESLVKKVNPKYAVICSSDKHPAEVNTIELLKKNGTEVLETRYGNITLISDGYNLELHQKVRH